MRTVLELLNIIDKFYVKLSYFLKNMQDLLDYIQSDTICLKIQHEMVTDGTALFIGRARSGRKGEAGVKQRNHHNIIMKKNGDGNNNGRSCC